MTMAAGAQMHVGLEVGAGKGMLASARPLAAAKLLSSAKGPALGSTAGAGLAAAQSGDPGATSGLASFGIKLQALLAPAGASDVSQTQQAAGSGSGTADAMVKRLADATPQKSGQIVAQQLGAKEAAEGMRVQDAVAIDARIPKTPANDASSKASKTPGAEKRKNDQATTAPPQLAAAGKQPLGMDTAFIQAQTIAVAAPSPVKSTFAALGADVDAKPGPRSVAKMTDAEAVKKSAVGPGRAISGNHATTETPGTEPAAALPNGHVSDASQLETAQPQDGGIPKSAAAQSGQGSTAEHGNTDAGVAQGTKGIAGREVQTRADAGALQATVTGGADRGAVSNSQPTAATDAPRSIASAAAAESTKSPAAHEAARTQVQHATVNAAAPATDAMHANDFRGVAIAAPVAMRPDAAAQPAAVRPVGGDEVFAAMDGQSAPTANWVHAGAHRAEAGYLDPALGWIGVRAETVGGAVHASIVPASADAAQMLGSHLPALGAYMAEHHATATQVTMSAPEMGSGAQSAQQGMSRDNGQESGARQDLRGEEAAGAVTRGMRMESVAAVPAAQWTAGLRGGATISLVA